MEYVVKESSPRELGLKMGGVMPLSFTLGLVFSVLFGTLRADSLSILQWWNIMYIVVASISLIHLVSLIFFVPDTPHWYYENLEIIKGDEVVRNWYIDTTDVIRNKAYVKDEASTKIWSHRSLAVSASNSQAVVSFAMATCGINFSFFFENNHMSSTVHMDSTSIKLVLMSFGLCLIIATSCLSNSDLYLEIPRKAAIVFGMTSMGVFQIVGGALIQCEISGYFYVIVMLMILISFEAGLGTFYWIYIPELIRVRRVSLAISVYWGVEVLMSVIYYLKSFYFSNASVYYAHGILNISLAGLLHFKGIETLGLNWKRIAEAHDEDSSSFDMHVGINMHVDIS